MTQLELETTLIKIVQHGKGYEAIEMLCHFLKNADAAKEAVIREAEFEREVLKKFCQSDMPATKKVKEIEGVLDV